MGIQHLWRGVAARAAQERELLGEVITDWMRTNQDRVEVVDNEFKLEVEFAKLLSLETTVVDVRVEEPNDKSSKLFDVPVL